MNHSTTLLYLIRHGATDANLRKPYLLQGQHSDLALSPTGRRQAESAAGVLDGCAVRAVYSSPLRRARDTAEIVAARQHIPVQSIDGLTECNVGEWEGLSWQEVRQRDPLYLATFEADLANVPYRNGESFQLVQDRAVPTIDRLVRECRGNLAVVTHNIVGRVFVAHVLGLPIAQARRIRLDNGGISIFSYTDQSPRLVTLNTVLHLDSVFDL